MCLFGKSMSKLYLSKNGLKQLEDCLVAPFQMPIANGVKT